MHDADQLTHQERQVAAALVRGASNRELADQLFVSVKTIETHLTRIYRKLHCRSRAQVLAAYYTGSLHGLEIGESLTPSARVAGGMGR